MKGGKALVKIQVSAVFHIWGIQRKDWFTQIYRALFTIYSSFGHHAKAVSWKSLAYTLLYSQNEEPFQSKNLYNY